MTNMRQAAQKLQEKHRLYDQYGKTFEASHKGQYLAISRDGQTILGDQSGEVLQQALEEFGRGKFGIFRVGHQVFAEWLLTS